MIQGQLERLRRHLFADSRTTVDPGDFKGAIVYCVLRFMTGDVKQTRLKTGKQFPAHMVCLPQARTCNTTASYSIAESSW